jgi:hypothetical protein
MNGTMLNVYLQRVIKTVGSQLSSDQFNSLFDLLRWYYIDWSNVDDLEANRQALNAVRGVRGSFSESS